jgi:hypothetical protein
MKKKTVLALALFPAENKNKKTLFERNKFETKQNEPNTKNHKEEEEGGG